MIWELRKEFVVDKNGVNVSGFDQPVMFFPKDYQVFDVRGHFRDPTDELYRLNEESSMVIGYNDYLGDKPALPLPPFLVVTLKPYVYANKKRTDFPDDLRFENEDVLLIDLDEITRQHQDYGFCGGNDVRGPGPWVSRDSKHLYIARFKSAKSYIDRRETVPYYDLVVGLTGQEYRRLQRMPPNSVMRAEVRPERKKSIGRIA